MAMRVFKNKEEAAAAGYEVGQDASFAFKRGAPSAERRAHIRSALEAQLAEALEAVEWSLADRDGDDRCPLCFARQENDDHTPGAHLEVCKLSLALKSFRGETP